MLLLIEVTRGYEVFQTAEGVTEVKLSILRKNLRFLRISAINFIQVEGSTFCFLFCSV